MTGKPQQMSTFAIRFNPASVNDDDDDELYDFEASDRPRREILQFERRSASPAPSQEGATNAVEIGVAADAASNDSMPASHPSSLWKSPQHSVRSAPVSEASSPLSPMKSSIASEADKNGTPGGKDDSQRSIFSELRERIVSQSREILPKRLNKTGSADTAKIVISPQDDKNITETEVKTKSYSRPGSGAGEALAKEILKAGSTECINSDWERFEDADFSVKRSSSTGQISSKQDMNTDPEPVKTGDASFVSQSTLTTVTMSELLSSSASTENLATIVTDTSRVKPASSKKVVAAKKSTDMTTLSVSGRIARLYSMFKIPGFLKRRNVLTLLALIFSLLILPLPPFVSGFVVGSFVTAVISMFIYVCFFSPAKEKTAPPPRDFKSLLPLSVPEMKESKITDGLFKGWMNELSIYDVNNYHINQTYSVFVTLEGSTMRLQTPKQGIAKRAMGDESIPSAVSFVRQKHYDLRGCLVTLLPADLVEKRLWSKKYPICLEINKTSPGEPAEKSPKSILESEVSSFDAQREWKSSPKQAATSAKVAAASGGVKCLYLFARSSREKEEWFRRFQAAAAATPWPTRMSDLLQKSSLSSPASVKSHVRTGSGSSIELQQIRHGSIDSLSSNVSVESLPSLEVDYGKLSPEKNLLEYISYMAKIMPAADSGSKEPSSSNGAAPELCDPQLLWLNAIISRCFLDFLREKYWTNKIRDKIQKKLGKIHVPHFIDQLTVTGIELGPQVPVICCASKPYLDDRGLWVDMDVSYGGGFCITMETKCNLMKLKSTKMEVHEEKPDSEKRTGALCSDEEDSAESTTDEEGAEENTSDDANSERRSEPMSKKLLKFVDKISKSRYFQQATDYRYIKKAMEEVSNTRLILNVEMKAVVGTLAVNIPPPPTNRIWYGFRGNPNLVLSAKPRVGEREVSLSHVTDWIEKKLAVEFQRVFVIPNMDDIPIPLMCEHLQPSPGATATAL